MTAAAIVLPAISRAEARHWVLRAIELSHQLAHQGNPRASAKAWLVASKMAFRCGGLAGASWAGGGYGGIVLGDGAVVVSPVSLRQQQGPTVGGQMTQTQQKGDSCGPT